MPRIENQTLKVMLTMLLVFMVGFFLSMEIISYHGDIPAIHSLRDLLIHAIKVVRTYTGIRYYYIIGWLLVLAGLSAVRLAQGIATGR